MLPEALLWLLQAVLANAQTTRPQLSLNSLSSFSPANMPSPPLFLLPKAQSAVALSVALCSGTGNTTPRFFVTNSSAGPDPGSSSAGDQDVFEISLNAGQGNWTGLFPDGGRLSVENAGMNSLEIGVSDSGPMHEHLSDPPLLGDTTSNQALLFSPAFQKSPDANFQPNWPNYTFQDANLSFPNPPSNPPNFTIVVESTSSDMSSFPHTGCVFKSLMSQGRIANQSFWLKDQNGWRSQWIIEGLNPSTNYTAYVVQGDTKVSGPLFFATKSPSFSCPLVSSLPYCPSISYTMPLPPPPQPFSSYDSTTLPQSISQNLISALSNFTTTLSTFACGRDNYSPIVTCADCQRAYRNWLCSVSLPRCGEPSPQNSAAFTASAPDPTQTGLSALTPTDGSGAQAQAVLSALVPQSSNSALRNPTFPNVDLGGTRLLLPCLETCTAVDRACPNFLGFRCPTKRFNAAASYGVGYIDSGEDGEQGGGVVGTAQDRYGNVWCNMV